MRSFWRSDQERKRNHQIQTIDTIVQGAFSLVLILMYDSSPYAGNDPEGGTVVTENVAAVPGIIEGNTIAITLRDTAEEEKRNWKVLLNFGRSTKGEFLELWISAASLNCMDSGGR